MAAAAETDEQLVIHDIIICTRNRPTDLKSSLDSIAVQTVRPSAVIVIDASDDDATERLVEEWSSAVASLGIDVRHYKAPPGLPAQRNLGVSHSEADVVHFLDDDVVLEAGYLAALVGVFEMDAKQRIVGAGGLITNQAPRNPRIWWRIARLDSKRSGVILRSGANVIVAAADERLSVQWLSGCSMSFRAHVVRELRFDETLPGYALMEDADFGFRAARLGALVLEPQARLSHHVSPVGRWSHPARERASTYRRGWFVEKNLSRWCLIPFWWSVVSGALVQGVAALAKRQRFGLRVALWRLQGGVDFLRGIR